MVGIGDRPEDRIAGLERDLIRLAERVVSAEEALAAFRDDPDLDSAVRRVIDLALAQAEEVRTRARAQIGEILYDAQELVAGAEQEGRAIVERATGEAARRAEVIMAEAENVRLSARRQADSLRAEIEQARHRAEERLEALAAGGREELRLARLEAVRILEEAEARAFEIRETASQAEATEMIRSARKEADEIRALAEADVARLAARTRQRIVDKEIEAEERLAVIEEQHRLTEEKLDQVEADHRMRVYALREELAALQQAITEAEAVDVPATDFAVVGEEMLRRIGSR